MFGRDKLGHGFSDRIGKSEKFCWENFNYFIEDFVHHKKPFLQQSI